MARAGGAPQPTITDDRALGAADIQRSLRFNRGDSPYLSRALGSPTSDDKASVSVWLKRTDVSTDNTFFDNYQGSNDRLSISLVSDTDGDALGVYQRDSSGIVCNLLTTQVFRDPSAWYHLLIAFDTTQGTAADRVKIYVNGTQVTSFSGSTYFSQNHNLRAGSGYTTNVGRYGAGSNYFGGYLAEFNYIDGQQLSPTDVGFTDSQTGIWMPKRYEGTYGNNGFHLDFSDNSSTAALGIDKSPNGNDLALSNLAVTDSVLDTPSNNFATWSKVDHEGRELTLSEGNLKVYHPYQHKQEEGGATLAFSSGKWYWEEYMVSSTADASMIGVGVKNVEGIYANGGNHWRVRGGGGETDHNGTQTNISGFSWTTGDIIGIAVDMDAGTWTVSKNGTFIGSNVHTNLSGTVVPTTHNSNSGENHTFIANFGQDSSFAGTKTAQGNKDANGIGDFYYPVPSGYKALCSKNLPSPTNSFLNPDQHFKALLYTGTGSSHIVEGLKFQPDLVWVKGRDTNGYEPMMIDSVRGGDNSLVTSDTASESTHGGRSMTFYNRGVRWNSDSGNCNANGEDYVLWCWKGGGTAVTNSDGSVDAQVSANPDAGFSVVTYSGSGNRTIGHGLNKAPEMIIMKGRNVTDQWTVGHKFLNNGSNAWNYGTPLQSTTNIQTNSTFWNNTAPTDTVFSRGSWNAGYNMISYCFHSVEGFSKFGTYKANGNNNGAFVNLGFRPAFVLTKMVDTMGENWTISDSSRSTYNPVDLFLRPDETTSDTSGAAKMDFLSNGFKLRNTDDKTNRSGARYIFMAFAEAPDATPFDTFPNAR